LSREQLLSRVWGFDFDPGSNVADVYIGYLRQTHRRPHARFARTVTGCAVACSPPVEPIG
ncbi:winged helix-turn-helix domain-containing protein, partial [Microbacterium sp. NPDC003461]